MTNKDLVKQLRTASIQADEMRLRDFGFLFKTAAEAIERLVAYNEFWENSAHKAKKLLEEKTPQWISVEERLPKDNEVVLVWGGASVYTAKRYNKYGGVPMWWKLNSKQHYCNPTHWMPLPNPPEKGMNE